MAPSLATGSLQRLAKTYNSAAESLLGPVTADSISLGKHTVEVEMSLY